MSELNVSVYGKIENEKIVFLALEHELPGTEKQAHDWRIWGQAEEEKYQEVLSGTWLGKPLFDENGVANYKFSDGSAAERTEKEKQEEIAARPSPLPSLEEQVKANSAAILALAKGVAKNV